MSRRKDWVGHGVIVTHTVSDFPHPTPYHGQSTNDVVRLHLGLRGDYRVRYPQLDRSYDLVGGHHNVFYAKNFELEFVNKTPSIETFGVQVPIAQFVSYVDGGSDALSRFCERITSGRMGMLFEQWGTINPTIEHAIRQFMTRRYTGGLQEAFVLSKSLDLLVLSIEAARTTPGQYLKTRADRDLIVMARDVVNERLADPPTLTEIARQVGINEYKLKRGFKEMFGTTVFTYLTEQRLDLAKQYLLDTDRSAAQIAFDLGYASPQHFHSAFKKRFGVTPNSMRKTPQDASDDG